MLPLTIRPQCFQAITWGYAKIAKHPGLIKMQKRFAQTWICQLGTLGGGNHFIEIQRGDDGHVWFNLGLFIPIGSYAAITYSGGYQTTPADLRRASKNMLASLILRELLPEPQGRDPDLLLHQAESICARYGRN